MLKIIFWCFCPLIVAGATSCSSIIDSQERFVSSSGVGTITVDSDTPQSLSRMAVIIEDDEYKIYLFGAETTIEGDGNLRGEGIVVLITIPNREGGTTLEATYSTIEDDVGASYSLLINYEDEEADNELVTLTSGCVIIRKNGSVYSLAALGKDSYGADVIVNFTGYLLFTIIPDQPI